jgi:hypothetical protein
MYIAPVLQSDVNSNLNRDRTAKRMTTEKKEKFRQGAKSANKQRGLQLSQIRFVVGGCFVG